MYTVFQEKKHLTEILLVSSEYYSQCMLVHPLEQQIVCD